MEYSMTATQNPGIVQRIGAPACSETAEDVVDAAEKVLHIPAQSPGQA